MSQIEELRDRLKKAEEALAACEKRCNKLDSLFNAIPVDIFVKDPSDSFRYVYCNKSFQDTQGLGQSVIGKTDYDIFKNKEDAERLRRDDRDVMAHGQRISFDESYHDNSGQTNVILVFKEPLYLDGYPQPLLLGTSLDMSSMPNISALLIKKIADVDNESKVNSANMANLRHEIRTPLNAIVGFTSLLNDETSELTTDQREKFLRLVKSNTALLTSIVNDVMSISKLEDGNFPFVKTEYDLNTMMYDVYQLYLPKFEGTDVSLVYRPDTTSPKMCRDEPKQLQIIYNFLNNAIKYTSHGTITLGYNVLPNDMIEMYVEDTGKGIAKENLSKVFNRFEKLGSRVEGYGLGLSIVKAISEAVGGSCGVSSELGVGSRFWVKIPIK